VIDKLLSLIYIGFFVGIDSDAFGPGGNPDVESLLQKADIFILGAKNPLQLFIGIYRNDPIHKTARLNLIRENYSGISSTCPG
jgi:hypothetical protein